MGNNSLNSNSLQSIARKSSKDVDTSADDNKRLQSEWLNATIINHTDTTSFGKRMIGKYRVNVLVSGYMFQSSRPYHINIPADITKLITSFCQISIWSITFDPNQRFQTKTFEISSNIKLDYEVEAQFEFSFYVSSLKVILRKLPHSHSSHWREQLLYTHLLCNELHFERKYTNKISNGLEHKFGFSKVPQSVTFDFYFQIFPVVSNRMNILSTLEHNKWFKYQWKLTKHVQRQMLIGGNQRWHSHNFYNEGCFCLSITDGECINFEDDTRRVLLSVHLLRHPMGNSNKSICISSVFEIYWSSMDGTSNGKEMTLYSPTDSCFIGIHQTDGIPKSVCIPSKARIDKIDFIFSFPKSTQDKIFKVFD